MTTGATGALNNPTHRSRAYEVEARQWSGSNWHSMLEWTRDVHGQDLFTDREPGFDGLVLTLADSEIRVYPGDWLIFGKGGWSALPDSSFQLAYEAV